MSVKVKQGEEEVPTEVLADAIVAISEGVAKLRRGRLKDRALLLLIQDAAPSPKRGRYRTGRPIPIQTIKDVLEGLESLKTQYVK
jgi:hypothetical protein